MLRFPTWVKNSIGSAMQEGNQAAADEFKRRKDTLVAIVGEQIILAYEAQMALEQVAFILDYMWRAYARAGGILITFTPKLTGKPEVGPCETADFVAVLQFDGVMGEITAAAGYAEQFMQTALAYMEDEPTKERLRQLVDWDAKPLGEAR